ncbi:hypothetical protein KM043_013375 [Ampulex compressa]|nr:hypothetical protein KM043_013375 [Ampulex compressa]
MANSVYVRMEVEVGEVTMPGDIVKDIATINKKERIILGPGLRREGNTVIACKAGILKKGNAFVYYVDNYQKRYVPHQGENVVGIITQKSGDIFKVDIGAGEQASLSYLAFEGATKKNRPDVQVGDVVFAKLLVASKDMEPELTFEVAAGMNGKIWVKARSLQETIAIANAILAAEFTSASETNELCTRVEKALLLFDADMED